VRQRHRFRPNAAASKTRASAGPSLFRRLGVDRRVVDRPSIVKPRARVDACDFVDQRDAILDRADRRAEVAADAFAFVDNELALAVDDAVAAALNAELLMRLPSRRVAFPPTARSGPSPRRPEPRLLRSAPLRLE
jgi:hypothetical protein